MTMTVSPAHSRPSTLTPRQRERRQTLGDLLTVLARRLDRRGDIALMRSTFEEALRSIVPVRSIRLRELAGRCRRHASQNLPTQPRRRISSRSSMVGV